MINLSRFHRLLLLLGCIAGGVLAGSTGHAWTGDAEWYLAIPGAVALGWLFVANPENCTGGQCQTRAADAEDRRDAA